MRNGLGGSAPLSWAIGSKSDSIVSIRERAKLLSSNVEAVGYKVGGLSSVNSGDQGTSAPIDFSRIQSTFTSNTTIVGENPVFHGPFRELQHT